MFEVPNHQCSYDHLQTTFLKLGNARFPSQYNQSHFTFISDENGVNNRYAGFFTTERAGLDTLIFIGDEVLRNPEQKEVDSLLKEWKKAGKINGKQYQKYRF